MKVYIPKRQLDANYIVPSWRRLLETFANNRKALAERGIDVEIHEGQKVQRGGSVYLTMALAGVNGMVRNRCHIISFWDDLHYFNEKVRQDRHKIFRTADTLLLPYYDHFFLYEEYRSYWPKAHPFPWFPAYSFPVGTREEWCNRARNILLSGRISQSYPLRRKIRRMVNNDENLSALISVLRHPGYNEKQDTVNGVLGKDYYEYLASSKASIVTSGKREDFQIDYMVAKYFEVPACGSLLLCERVPWMEKRGFVDGQNCVYLDKSDLGDQLLSIASNVDEYYDIAARGKELIDRRHSLAVRRESLIHMMKSIGAQEGLEK